MNIDDLKLKIFNAINKLYQKDCYLFANDLNERSLTSKLAQYLEEENFGDGYFVDHEYNRAYSSDGSVASKMLISEDGNSVDIVITKRDNNPENDLVCFEVKKMNKFGKEDAEKDREKLMVLSGSVLPHKFRTKEIIKDKDGFFFHFNYDFACYIILGETKEGTVVEIYRAGHRVEKYAYGNLL